MKSINFVAVLIILSISTICAGAIEYPETTPAAGDGIYNLLRRYDLPTNSAYVEKFKELNAENLTKSGGLILGEKYKLPIVVYQYNMTSIRTTIGNDDYEYALGIAKWNDGLTKKGVKSDNYRNGVLWVPLFGTEEEVRERIIDEPLFGEQLRKVKATSNFLAGRIYYIVAGHGGPDPGAIGEKAGSELCEDEYAYDVCLRLARNLMEKGAGVYVITQDPNDGIRDEKYLKCDKDEIYFGGAAIPADQLPRLKKRADIINKLYRKHKGKALSQQALVVHVDSRYVGKRIDIFFYHHENSSEGKSLAETLLTTIKSKYDQHQPGRGYEGTVSHRNLYMLRKTHPVTVYIELGNIQNSLDQVRIIESDNRQAVANWLCDGLIKFAGGD